VENKEMCDKAGAVSPITWMQVVLTVSCFTKCIPETPHIFKLDCVKVLSNSLLMTLKCISEHF